MAGTGTDAAIMMTLSAIAYQSDIPGQLSHPQYATNRDWSLAWGPVSDDYGNLLYVATSASTGAYAVAIRGSELLFNWTSFENWFYDLDVLTQVEWPYFGNSNNDAVSSGAYIQAVNLTKATHSGLTLLDFLSTRRKSSVPLYVTGHSLGGNLATVLAAWLSSQLGPAAGQQDTNTRVYTFATPSPGNASFVSSYNQRFPNSWRYLNSLDVVPRAWADLLAINSVYDTFFLSTPVTAQVAVTGMQGLLEASEFCYGSWYDQTNSDGNVLPGDFALLSDWFSEVAHQHWSNTYLSLLGAPPIQPGLQIRLAAGEIATMTPPVLKKPRFGGDPAMEPRRR